MNLGVNALMVATRSWPAQRSGAPRPARERTPPWSRVWSARGAAGRPSGHARRRTMTAADADVRLAAPLQVRGPQPSTTGAAVSGSPKPVGQCDQRNAEDHRSRDADHAPPKRDARHEDEALYQPRHGEHSAHDECGPERGVRDVLHPDRVSAAVRGAGQIASSRPADTCAEDTRDEAGTVRRTPPVVSAPRGRDRTPRSGFAQPGRRVPGAGPARGA